MYLTKTKTKKKNRNIGITKIVWSQERAKNHDPMSRCIKKSAPFRACIVMMDVENTIMRTTILSISTNHEYERKRHKYLISLQRNLHSSSFSLLYIKFRLSSYQLEHCAVMEKMHYATGLQSIMNSGP